MNHTGIFSQNDVHIKVHSMIKLEDIAFRKLDFSGLKTLLSWAQQEGWNPGPYDAEAYWYTDSDGFYGFYLDDTLIAGGAIVSYNGEFGFMGLFIVKPEYRTNGLGRKLWYLRRNLLIDRLHDKASIGMDGVVEMQHFYQKGGFEIAYTEERYEKLGIALETNNNISTIATTDFDQIASYDKQCFGFSRINFLKSWINLPENKTFTYKIENQIKGFAIVRKVANGYKIGPLFADNHGIAEELYKACLNSVIDNPCYIDVPVINKNAIEMIKKYEAKYVFECARMYYGKPPQIDTTKIYGVTSFELG